MFSLPREEKKKESLGDDDGKENPWVHYPGFPHPTPNAAPVPLDAEATGRFGITGMGTGTFPDPGRGSS